MLSKLFFSPAAQTAVLAACKTSFTAIAAINFAGYTATALLETHKITDLCGTSAFAVSSLATYYLHARTASVTPLTSILLTICVSLWSIRLASFLQNRIMTFGVDTRLGKFFRKQDEPWFTGPSVYPVRLAVFWTIQAAWGFLTLLPVTFHHALASVSTSSALHSLGWAKTGLFAAFAVGLVIEVLADEQKKRFKSEDANKDKWISSGVWKYSRHPNYLGEMVIWWSIFGISSLATPYPMMMMCTSISPIFLSLLLKYVSGVNLAEKKYDQKFGSNPEYLKYKENTPELFPRLPWQ